MKMKPFNLKAFTNGHPAVTRDGRKAEFVEFNDGSVYALRGILEGEYHVWMAYGAYTQESENDLDLVGMWEGEEVTDNVNHPEHYTTGSIECIDAIRAALTVEEFRGYCKGNTLKYVWRERYKGQDESLQKAVWYMNKLLEGIENE